MTAEVAFQNRPGKDHRLQKPHPVEVRLHDIAATRRVDFRYNIWPRRIRNMLANLVFPEH